MKQMKKLTRNQKIILSGLGYDAKKYALVSDDGDTFTVGSKVIPERQTTIEYTSSTTGKVLDT